ncbi:MAG: LytR C-terminal domain-containing protein [Actinomycetaceae bacterium]|nr:LytR C-terminal domain-containing protein [Actinomycetaceae bacterium]MDY6082266.1 LytR C-terminal domain-containing protein [Actinomycetaceae bacterium]
MESEYAEDEFDRLAAQRDVVGAHRAKQSNRAWWIGLFAVIVIAPLLGWGIVHFILQADEAPHTAAVSASPSASESASASPSAPSGAGTPSQSPTEEEQRSSTPSSTSTPSLPDGVAADSEIYLMASSSDVSLRQQMADTLKEHGFTNIDTARYTKSAPRSTTVYYQGSAQKAAAEYIGQTLNLDSAHIIRAPEISRSHQITVVVRK